MSLSVGGTSGITWPDSTTTAAASVTAKLTPAITDTANVMTIQPLVIMDGTNGIYANNTVYRTA
jgi:hypothetical protein